jgi:hypothetical protein
MKCEKCGEEFDFKRLDSNKLLDILNKISDEVKIRNQRLLNRLEQHGSDIKSKSNLEGFAAWVDKKFNR